MCYKILDKSYNIHTSFKVNACLDLNNLKMLCIHNNK